MIKKGECINDAQKMMMGDKTSRSARRRNLIFTRYYVGTPFQYCVTGTEFVTLGNGIRYTN